MTDRGLDADQKYARGELTREEWMERRRIAAPPAPGLPAAAPSAASARPNRRGVLLVAVVLVVGLTAAAALLIAFGLPGGPSMGPSYGSVRQLQAADLDALNASATHGTAFAGNNSLWFPAGPVTLVVYASPMEHDLTFEIQGMTNPAIHMAAGSRVTLTIVNVDASMYHNWAMTTQGPPYSSMPMMGSGTMMMTMQMLGPMTMSGMWSQQASFTAPAGSSWYLCTFAGHATSGMYGSFIGA